MNLTGLTRADGTQDMFEYIEAFPNLDRKYANGMLPPVIWTGQAARSRIYPRLRVSPELARFV